MLPEVETGMEAGEADVGDRRFAIHYSRFFSTRQRLRRRRQVSIITRQVLIMKWQVPGVGEAGVSRYTKAMQLDVILDLFRGGF